MIIVGALSEKERELMIDVVHFDATEHDELA